MIYEQLTAANNINNGTQYRAHTSAKAADAAELLVQNKRDVTVFPATNPVWQSIVRRAASTQP